MFENPYRGKGRWWKVGFHAHTTNSDGRGTPEQVADRYGKLGFDALVITDHEYVTRLPDRVRRPLVIPAAEIWGWPDVVYLGAKETGKLRLWGAGLQPLLNLMRRRGGLPVISHPAWSGISSAELAGARGYVGIEIYSHSKINSSGKTLSTETWDHLLAAGRKAWGFASDDSHGAGRGSFAGKGFLWVKAPALTVRALLAAIKRGSFCASQGPGIFDVRAGKSGMEIKTTPGVRAYCVSAGEGGGGCLAAPPGKTRTRWRFQFSVKRITVQRYVRFEVLDSRGRRAWTNPLFIRGKGKLQYGRPPN